MSDRERELRALVAKIARSDVSHLSLDDDVIEALALDSLAELRLLAAIEKRFGVRLPDERLGDVRTLRQMLDALCSIEVKS